MLESLRIENLILIRHTEIHFGKGLNILTGETGSGKSAVLTAIRLLAGEKADAQLLSDPTKPAIIEGKILFQKLAIPELDLFGDQQTCTIRREILPSGKSRAFFEGRLIGIVQLKKLVRDAIEFANQSGVREILSSASQRDLLDLWAGADTSRIAYAKQLSLTAELDRLKEEKKSAHLSLEFAQLQIGDIEEVNWKLGEEETLTEEHKNQANAADTTQTLSSVLSELSENSLSSKLRKLANQLPKNEAAALLTSASVEVMEAERLIETSLGQCEPDPHRLEMIEKRIAQIEKIKRKYGRTLIEVDERMQTLKQQVTGFEQIDDRIEAAEAEQLHLRQKNQEIADELSLLRQKQSLSLQEELLTELKSLHLPHARFEISLETKPLGPDGCDCVRFLFSANPGQPLQPLEECASGGEQSRIFFALKSVMAKKEERDCLVLDEIDSNVGGVAASILGQKLQTLGQERQLICITHFVQAAQYATLHFLVEKSSSASDAVTTVRLLNDEEKRCEYQRMMGNQK